MLEENSIGLISEQFEKNVKEFALSDENRPSYKFTSSHFKEDIKEKKGYIYYDKFIIVFAYSFESPMTSPKSILDCRVSFTKNDTVEYPFYDLLGIINPDDFKCYMFAYIESADRMRSCFSFLAEALRRYMPDIRLIAEDEEKLAFLDAQRTENLKTLYGKFYNMMFDGEDELNDFFNDNYCSMYHMIFSSGRYNDFLKGNYRKAKKKYLKAKKLIGYEQRLLDFLTRLPAGAKYDAAAPGLNTLDEVLKEATGNRGLGILLFSIFCFTPFLLVLFASFYLLVVKLIYRNAVFVTNLDLNSAMNMFLPAMLASILLSYYWREWISKRIYPKSHMKRLLYDKILNRRHEECVMRRFTYIVVTGCMLFLFLSANSILAFYDNGLSNNLTFFSLNGEYIRYDRIDSVWEISGRENSIGMRIENLYYIILLKNGDKLDFSSDVYDYQFTEKIIPLLTEKGIISRTAASEDEVRLSS